MMRLAALALGLSLLAAASAAGAATPAAAVVVAKDRSRSALVLSSPAGNVRTVAVPAAAFRRTQVGSRVVVRTSTAAGVLSALSLRASGRADRALVRGVVVRFDSRLRRAVLSAGGTALRVRLLSSRSERRLASRGPELRAGDHVRASVHVESSGALSASSIAVTASTAAAPSGIEGKVEVKGSVVALAPLTVRTGTGVVVACDVPAGFSPGALAVGARVELTCVVDGGRWVVRSVELEDDAGDDEHEGRGDDDEDDGDKDADERELEGTLVSLDPVTVEARGGRLVCAVPDGVSLAGFAVGDRVELKCALVQGSWVLERLEREDDEDDESEGRS